MDTGRTGWLLWLMLLTGEWGVKTARLYV